MAIVRTTRMKFSNLRLKVILVYLELKRPFRNTNTGHKALSFIGPSFWNQIPETLKKTDN